MGMMTLKDKAIKIVESIIKGGKPPIWGDDKKEENNK
jgi:hypothetical protein